MDGVTRRPDFRSHAHGGSITASPHGLRSDTRPVADIGTPKQPTGHYSPEPSYHPQLGALRTSTTSTQQSGSGPIQGSFDAEVRGAQGNGQAPPAIDLEAAEVAGAVYDPNISQVGRWSRLSDAQLRAAGIDPTFLENSITGFRAGIFTDGQGRYLLAFAGTNDVVDWSATNIPQEFGGTPAQYAEAAALARLAKTIFGDNLVLTGHSLGGNQAAIGSAVTGNAAVTFNAAGMHDNTLLREGLDPAQVRRDAQNGQIRNYTVDGEPLTSAQEDSWLRGALPDALGSRTVLDQPPRPPMAWHSGRWGPALNAWNLAKRLFDRHYQSTVLEAMRQLLPQGQSTHRLGRDIGPMGPGANPRESYIDYARRERARSSMESLPGNDRGPGRANHLENLRQSFDDYSSGQGHGGVRDRAENNASRFGSGTQRSGSWGGYDGGSSSDRSDSSRSSSSGSSRGGGIGSDYGADRSRDNSGRDRGGIGGDYGNDGSGSRSNSNSGSSGGIGSDYGADRSRDNPGRDRGGIGGDYGTDGSGSRSSSDSSPGSSGGGGIGSDYGADRSRDGTGGNGDYGHYGDGMV